MARFVPFDLVTAELHTRGSDIIAEAIVIDGARRELNGDDLDWAARLANEIRGLPEHATMQNGIRWRHVPIAITVESDEMARRTHGDPALRDIVVVSAFHGWQRVYKVLSDMIRDFAMELVEQYREVGWEIQEDDYGRVTRMKAPKLKRRDGKLDPIETEFYDSSADRWFAARANRTRLPLQTIYVAPEAVEHDIRDFRKLIRPQGLLEGEYQRFLNERTYFFGAAQYEMLPRPELWDPDNGKFRYPDYSINPTHFTDDDPLPHFLDLKTPDSSLLTSDRGFPMLTRPVQSGLRQMRGFQDIARDPRGKEYVDRIFPQQLPLGAGKVIIGLNTSNHRRAFEKERALYRDLGNDAVEVYTYDEVLEMVERTYLDEYTDVEDPYGILEAESFDTYDHASDAYDNSRRARNSTGRRRPPRSPF
jgi:hypothetical protein